MEYKWDQDKPDNITELYQRRQQTENFLDYNPGAKPKDKIPKLEKCLEIRNPTKLI